MKSVSTSFEVPTPNPRLTAGWDGREAHAQRKELKMSKSSRSASTCWRGLTPRAFFCGLPARHAVLPIGLARLFARDKELWCEIAKHEAVSRDQLDVDLFEPMLRRRC